MSQQYNGRTSDFVGARATFKDTTKDGKEKLNMFLGAEDVKQLIEKIQAAASADGVRLSIILTPKDGKVRGSILVSDGAGGKGQGAGPAKPVAFVPKKSFAFKPKA